MMRVKMKSTMREIAKVIMKEMEMIREVEMIMRVLVNVMKVR